MPDLKNKARKSHVPMPASARGVKKKAADNRTNSGKALATGARIRPVPLSRMQEEWVKTLTRIPGAGLKGKFFPGNVLGTLMHNPRTLGTFLDYWVTSKSEMGFPVREQELIILRMGFLYKCDYVWRHHVPVAREFGVTEEEIAAVRTSPLLPVFSKREAVLLKLTDEMVEQRTVRSEVWEECKGVLSKSEWIDMATIVSQYVLFALVNNSMQVQLEAPLREIPAL